MKVWLQSFVKQNPYSLPNDLNIMFEESDVGDCEKLKGKVCFRWIEVSPTAAGRSLLTPIARRLNACLYILKIKVKIVNTDTECWDT